MIAVHVRTHLPPLGIASGFHLALPDIACEHTERIPFALCLHDYGQNGEQLLRLLCCADLVDQTRTALLLPNGQNSCFMNMAHGPAWETYLLQGLLPLAKRSFPLGGAPKLFGLGTGGWAAARLAKQYPDRFAASMAVDSDIDFQKTYAQGSHTGMPDVEAVFGDATHMPYIPLCDQTRILKGIPASTALKELLTEDRSTPA